MHVFNTSEPEFEISTIFDSSVHGFSLRAGQGWHIDHSTEFQFATVHIYKDIANMITAIAQSSHPLPSSGMSNSDSPPNFPEKLPLTRKRSAVLKKVKGNWCDGESSEKTSVDEKDISELKLPLFAFEMHSFVENDDGIAYKAFLKAYPEYRLTWIIDKLRQTDFARLDRTGETYVDYMGGAMYPESLIRAHTMFLNQNVLGNTHSVSNRYVNKMFARTTY